MVNNYVNKLQCPIIFLKCYLIYICNGDVDLRNFSLPKQKNVSLLT